MAYITWLDARQHVDTAAVGDLDPARAQRMATEAETRLNNRLRQHMAVPIDRERSPEAFRQAQEICSRWTAAEYLRWKLSAHGSAEETWFADHLDKQAEELIQTMLDRLQAPEDAVAPGNGMVFTPYSGDQDAPAAIFRRSNVADDPTGGGRW